MHKEHSKFQFCVLWVWSLIIEIVNIKKVLSYIYEEEEEEK